MANQLDELTGPVNNEGHDVRVINKRLPVQIGLESTLFEIALWVVGPIIVLLYMAFYGAQQFSNPTLATIIGCVIGICPGIIFFFMKMNALNYFQQLEQRIQAEASTIDNYIEQRVQVLQNAAKLVEKSMDFDKEVMTAITTIRKGDSTSSMNSVADRFSAVVENYPDLMAHGEIAEAMRQNKYLQQEITAARDIYNSRVAQWNTSLYDWPAKMIVAAKQGYTTRIPYSASEEVHTKAREVFF